MTVSTWIVNVGDYTVLCRGTFSSTGLLNTDVSIISGQNSNEISTLLSVAAVTNPHNTASSNVVDLSCHDLSHGCSA